ncbi:probable inactive receptor kinase At1g48480 [Camellia sinensis]|uniref:probable inactive receptor kinase At1g48480 n=1 Tax=Camellia sinensis TaxID=4442 RepID=UPI00103665C6|nr:probable inactive receptor kinase At1g48480 [Camellia sinensis]
MNPYILCLLLLLLLLFPTAKPDLASDRAALLALRSAVGGRSLLWNLSEATPCFWPGVSCDNSSSVTQLRLPAMGLSGQLPPNSISNLTHLHTLSLRFNSLSGPLPSDFSSLSSLRNLYLQDNLFSGPIPDFLFSLPYLVRLNLASNHFSGPISLSFNNLTRLATLFLQNNNLSGSIPDLNMTTLAQFNVSNNHLTGPIPSILARQPASAFSGNSLCGEPLTSCNGTSIPTKKKLSGGAIAGIIIGSVIGLLVLVAILIFLCLKKSSEKADSKEVAAVKQTEVEIPGRGDDSGTGYPAMAARKGDVNVNVSGSGSKSLVFFGKSERGFDLEDLLKASAEVLGKGTFGTAYKAVLETGTVVAVKRLRDVTVPEKEFREKIEAVGVLNHENLVPLMAYYYSRDEKLLVYDYMPMGSFSALLHGNRGAGRTPLNWETRSAIALGAARGIAFLHSQGPTVAHGNIKSSNVLLTKSYEARVSDFGLSQVVGPSSTPNRIAGYRAPEVTDTRKVSQKADVYSFGVLLLEMLTGKAPMHAHLNEEGVDLPRWVQSVVREEWTAEVFDLELLRYQNVEEEMVQLLQLAIDCVAQYPDKRPSMAEVSSRIEELCRSSLQQQHDPLGDIISDDAEEQQAYSVDSGAPQSSVAD